MKTIKKLKLNKLNDSQLSKSAQNRLKGGARCCICNCSYWGGMSSSSADNSSAMLNSGSSGLYSPGGGSGSGSYS